MSAYVRSHRATRWGRDDWGREIALERRPGPWHVDPDDRAVPARAVCGVKLRRLDLAAQRVERDEGGAWPDGSRCRWCARGERNPRAGHRLRRFG